MRTGLEFLPAAPVDRRTLIKAAGFGAAAGAFSLAQAEPAAAQAAAADAPADLITRQFPKGSEIVPAIGLGTFITFDLIPGARRDHLLEVSRRFWQAGGRVFDTSPLYGMAEVNVGHFASTLGINDRMFISNKVLGDGRVPG